MLVALLFSRTSFDSVINLLFAHNRIICMSPSMNILAYPIDSVANIVNSITEENKIGKSAKFCILDELQHFQNVLFGLFARSSDSSPNRLFTTSLFTPAPKEKKRAK